MAKDVHTFTGEEVIATEVPQYLNQNFGAIPNNLGVWEANEAVSVGDTRILNGRENAGYILECIEAGTTGDSQPTISSSDIDNSTDLEGFSGTLQIVHGGHGANTAEGARRNLGLGSVAIENIVPVSKGGIGATTTESARANLGLRIQTFTSTSELGLTNNATELDILNAMPVHSVFQCAVTKASFPSLFLWNHTSSNTRLRLTRTNNNSFVLEAFVILSGTTIFMAVSNTDRTSVEYIKVADGNGYLPLTGGELKGQVRVNKGSNWGQFVAYSASGYYRAFEADDGRLRLDVRSTTDTSNRRIFDIRSFLGSSDLNSAILLIDTVDGVDKAYKIYGEHNIADKIIDSYGDDYIRFSSGLQICYGTIQNSGATISQHNWEDVTWTFPLAFKEAPKVFPVHAGTATRYADIVLGELSKSTTSVKIRFLQKALDAASNTSVHKVDVIAIGKWK